MGADKCLMGGPMFGNPGYQEEQGGEGTGGYTSWKI